MRLPRLIAILVALSACAGDAGAQWLKLPTPGLPRLPDGTRNLTTPAPRTPDGKPDLRPGDVAPWADALYRTGRLEFGKDSMETRCLPLGPAYLTTRFREIRIVQTEGREGPS